jgi:hypothetical protein
VQHPEHIYYAALVLLGIPAALHAGIARILVAAGVLSCVAWLAGFSMPAAYLAIHASAGVAAIACCRSSTRSLMVVSLFVDLFIIDVFELGGLFTAHGAWWARWWLVNAQLLLLAPDAWASIRRAVRWTWARPDNGIWLKFEPVV